MSKLGEMLNETGEVWFIIGGGKYDRRRFLYWAKKQGLKWWPKKREIKKSDECFFHMAVKQDKTIANIPAICVKHSKNKPKYVLEFKDFLKEN